MRKELTYVLRPEGGFYRSSFEFIMKPYSNSFVLPTVYGPMKQKLHLKPWYISLGFNYAISTKTNPSVNQSYILSFFITLYVCFLNNIFNSKTLIFKAFDVVIEKFGQKPCPDIYLGR